MVRKFTGLVSPHSGCTLNKFSEQLVVVGSLMTYDVTGVILLSIVQRVGAGLFNQARVSGSFVVSCGCRVALIARVQPLCLGPWASLGYCPSPQGWARSMRSR